MPVNNFTGQIVSKSEKTLKVKVIRTKKVPIYEKRIKLSKFYLVHNPENLGEVGQNIEFKHTSPKSAKKHFEIVKVVT